MDLYLMQHGVAVPASEDPERPLSAEGRTSVARVVGQAARSGVAVERCLHSGKLRAEQTGRLLADGLGAALAAREGLKPKDPVAPVAEWLHAGADGSTSLALVGHLPFLDRLTSALVTGDESAQVLAFHNAALVKLVPKEGRPGWRIDWVLAPDLTPGPG